MRMLLALFAITLPLFAGERLGWADATRLLEQWKSVVTLDQRWSQDYEAAYRRALQRIASGTWSEKDTADARAELAAWQTKMYKVSEDARLATAGEPLPGEMQVDSAPRKALYNSKRKLVAAGQWTAEMEMAFQKKLVELATATAARKAAEKQTVIIIER